MFRNVHPRLCLTGFVIWFGATVVLRFAGQYLLDPGRPLPLVLLFAVSFPLMAWIVRGLCRDSRLPAEQWPSGAISVALPTLLLDPFSSAFFPVVFPNMAPQMAGVFGGWMLWCCAGALAGVTVGRATAVGQPIVAADSLSGGSSRLKAGSGNSVTDTRP